MRIERMRLHRAKESEVEWLRDMLNRESKPFGVTFAIDEEMLVAAW